MSAQPLDPRAIIAVLTGILILCLMDTMIKSLSGSHSVGQILFLRYFCGAPFAIAFFLYLRTGLPGLDMVRAHALRSVIIVVTAAQFFFALSVLPLAEAMALSFLAPLFTAILASLMLKEHIPVKVYVAVAVGFGGVIVIAYGQIGQGETSTMRSFGIAAAIGCAFTYALNLIYLRQRAQTDPLSTIVLLQHILPLFLTFPFAFLVWSQPTPGQWLTYMGIGFCGVCGHLSFAYGYSRAAAGRLGVLEYSSLIWGVALGYFIFGEVPGLQTLIGSGFIIAACIWSASGAAKKEAVS